MIFTEVKGSSFLIEQILKEKHRNLTNNIGERSISQMYYIVLNKKDNRLTWDYKRNYEWLKNYGYTEVCLDTFVKAIKEFEVPIMVGDHKVIFTKGRIEVGCHTLSNSVVRKIAANLQD